MFGTLRRMRVDAEIVELFSTELDSAHLRKTVDMAHSTTGDIHEE